MTYLIEAHDLVKYYGNIAAVSGLSFNVEEGSVTGLVGPNGAGKTTTIKMIIGILKPNNGQVRVFNEDPWDNVDIRYQIGVVYERACFPTSYKVIEYLERACRIFGKPKYRAKEVLLEVGLDGSENKPIKGLSAGMLQKFSVAHALVHEPRLIIADEPTANLDPEARGNLLSLILKLNRDKKITFLISSHILFELSRVCNSMVIINRGKVWASGKLDDLLNKLETKLVRVSTDKPEELAAEVKKLSYVAHVEADVRSILIGVTSEDYNRVYSDILDIAKKLGAKITGMESSTASLEELFKLAVKNEETKR